MPSMNVPDVAGLHSNLAIKFTEESVRNTWHCLTKIRAEEGKIVTLQFGE